MINQITSQYKASMYHRKLLTAEELVSLQIEFPENFDYVGSVDNLNGEMTIQSYNFNLYELIHYKILPQLVETRSLDKCTQVTLGCYLF